MCFHNSPAFQVSFASPLRIVASLAIILTMSTGEASAQCPPPATVFVESRVAASGLNATVGFRDCGEFIIAWEAPIVGSPNDRDILVQRFNPDGSLFDIAQMAIPVSASPEPGSAFHQRASLAMSPLGNVSIAWSEAIRGRFCKILGVG